MNDVSVFDLNGKLIHIKDAPARKLANTPFAYGAKADGVSDDWDAINACVRNNTGYVFFPKGNYAISKSIVIPSNTTVYMSGCEIVPILPLESMFIIENGSENITIRGGTINANNKCNIGITVYNNVNNITLSEIVVKNVHGTARTYGIAVPCFGASGITIDGCIIDTVESADNGEIADAQGWAKGIIVGFNGWLNNAVPENFSASTYSKNIVIKNNTIRNVKTGEDGDGIYIEGITLTDSNTMLYDLPVVIDNNYFENCGKRFIKVLPCGGCVIRNNRGVITGDTWMRSRMHSFVSIYAPSAVIENNFFENKSTVTTLYCIDFGVQSKWGSHTPSKLIIKNNTIINNDNRGNENTSCLYYANYGSEYSSVIIEDNIFIANYYGFNADCGNATIMVLRNNIFTGKSAFRAIQSSVYFTSFQFVNNTIEAGFSNAPINLPVQSGNVMIIQNYITAVYKSIIGAWSCIIRGNYVANTSRENRFEINAGSWYLSELNNDASGGKPTW